MATLSRQKNQVVPLTTLRKSDRSAPCIVYFCAVREEGCIGVGIENAGQKVNCYLFNLNGQDTEDVVPPPGIEHWINGKKFTL